MYGDHIIPKELKAEAEKKETDEEVKEMTEEKEEEEKTEEVKQPEKEKKKNKGIFGIFRSRDNTGASVEPQRNMDTETPLDDIRNTAPQSDLTPEPERDDLLLAAQRNKMRLDKEMDTEEIIQKIDKHAHFDPDAEQVLRRRKRVSKDRPIMLPMVGLPAN